MNNAKRNWKTTLAGIFTLAFLGLNIASDPKAYTDPQKQLEVAAQVIAGVGLIAAKDGDKTGTAPAK